VTNPWKWYDDAEILRREQERVFAQSWQYVGRAEEAASVGDYFTAQLGRIPVVVTHAEDGGVRAFANVCLHRGSLVAEGSGNRRTLQCPYHAWTYALDGELRAAPRAEFDLDGLRLVPLRLERWGPFLFANAAEDAQPLAEVLADVPAQLAAAGIDVDALAFHHRTRWTVEANWKVVAENFLECYHCAVAHPGFSALVDVSPHAYRLEQGRWHSSQHGPLRESGDEQIEHGQFHFLWPTTMINVFPGRPNLSIGSVAPAGTQRTERTLDYFFAPGEDERWIAELLELDDQVGREDTALVERVQRGVAAGVVESGRLLGEAERLVAHFQQLVREALA
jgi:phenylpropionate dioxygenase-like ring-hydroxylating dioxygenase large terminal subunit